MLVVKTVDSKQCCFPLLEGLQKAVWIYIPFMPSSSIMQSCELLAGLFWEEKPDFNRCNRAGGVSCGN